MEHANFYKILPSKLSNNYRNSVEKQQVSKAPTVRSLAGIPEEGRAPRRRCPCCRGPVEP